VTIQAIQTRYAGCMFRSRLEARWAVFFDELGIPWEYEPQGYTIGPDHDRRPYLPDFYLPELALWVEVKGKPLTDDELWLVCNSTVTHSGWGLPDGGGKILLLGGIPDVRDDVRVWHPLFQFHKGDIYRSHFEFTADKRIEELFSFEWLILPWFDGDGDVNRVHGSLSVGNPSPMLHEAWVFGPIPPLVRDAYAAARSARFEHGHSGAVR